ncbi:MAG: PAS domain S-box protein [Bacteroidales bacterium]|nr:PAS domain S-box protein [Bacteroidales bacterium]
MNIIKYLYRSKIIVTTLFLLIAVLGAMYIRNTWITTRNATSVQALKTASTLEIALNDEMLLKLHGSMQDTGTTAYKTIKKKLTELRTIHPDVRFLYIYVQKDDKIYFLVDSEPVDSKDYSFPGQEYLAPNDEYRKPFENGKPLITKPSTDPWGTWVSILVPVKSIITGEVIAVLGLDYPAEMWENQAMENTKHAITNLSFLIAVIIFLITISNKNIKLKRGKKLSDITKDELTKSEARYRGLLLNLDSGVVVHASDTSITLANPRASALLGLSEDQMKGRLAFVPHWEFITETSQPIPPNEYPVNLIANSKKPIKNYVLGIARPLTKDIVWCLVNGVPVFESDGILSEIIISFQDITDLKETEEALRRSEIKIRAISESAQDAILIMDSKSIISYWNPAASRIFGYTSSEAIGQNVHLLITPSRYLEAHNAAFTLYHQSDNGAVSGKTFDLEALRKDGTEIPVQLSLSLTKIEGEWNTIGIVRDITESRLAEKKLKEYTDQIELTNNELHTALIISEDAIARANEMTKQAEIANKSKSVFLANMSHEIRTPLNAIIGFSQILNRDPLFTNSQKEYLRSIITAGEHLLMLINDILELSKVEAGRTVLNPVNVDLYSLFADIQLIFKEQTNSKHLQFIFETTNIIERYVFVDEKKLRQIFINLIGNAIKFTNEGGIAVRVRFDKVEEKVNKMTVEIEDSGPGIPETEIDQLFKHFVQTSSGLKNGSGTGLGLILSRELAILMGGDITVSSQVGIGSVFTFHVMTTKGENEIIKPNDDKRIMSIEKGQKPFKILVVDDKTENLRVAVNLLNLVGFETNEAINGEDAIKKFNDWNPDLILMDMRMPVMDGYEATRKIKSTQRGKQTPIIALTASTFEEERNEIKSLDIQGYIRKPFKENDLFNTIGKVLAIKYNYEVDTSKLKDQEVEEGTLESISTIPLSLVSEMSDAVSVADLDKLIALIINVEPINPKLAKYLMTLANSYDYMHLQQLLNKK